jgi:hypothetical protein
MQFFAVCFHNVRSFSPIRKDVLGVTELCLELKRALNGSLFVSKFGSPFGKRLTGNNSAAGTESA